ncbi:UNVERIFIED_CONTAM: hypothetical protein Slati_1467200 [Sesamum latifolium]|uniref:Helitron helicase-like domain-containing protein n=1 Tax=Sesamum latifolium TaxID=2727402 RepID=A0AAW2X5L7_9LAMI
MLNNIPSSENIALPTEHQSLVSNLQLVDESSIRHEVMPPNYCANNYGSSCQNVHRRNDPNLREHQELGKDPSSLDQGECDGDVNSDATGKVFILQESSLKHEILDHQMKFVVIANPSYGGRRTRKFKQNIRSYNSMFAFTSTGGTIEKEINNGGGLYVYRINGQNHHRIGSLLPPAGRSATFAQLYIYDTQNEIRNRMRAVNQSNDDSSLDPTIVQGLKDMLDEFNPLATVFRMARDHFQESDFVPVSIRLIGQRNHDGRQYNLQTASEVAALIIGDGHQSTGNRDIIVETQSRHMRRITELHPSFMAMQYPILFPYAEDDFRTAIPRSIGSNNHNIAKRKWVTMSEFHAYRNQNREGEGQTLVRGGRLYNQYIVDVWTCIEENNLNWVRNNQRSWAELYR